MTDETWRDAAACIGEDTNLFFPASEEAHGPALGICRRCPVRQACLDYALSTGQNFGIWGGVGGKGRERMRRDRRRAA